MRRLAVTMALVAALALTGCGDDDDGGKAAPTTTAPPTTAAPLVGDDQAGTPFCQLARTFTDRYSALLGAAGDPAKLRALSTDAESSIRQAQATAPPEVKADVTVVATTASQVLAGLQRNDFDVVRTPEVAKLQEPAFQSSVASLTRYTRAHCGTG